MQWQADAIQAVIHTAPFSSTADAASLWTAALGDTPDAYQRNPNSPAPQSNASGERQGFHISIATQPSTTTVSLNAIYPLIDGLMQPSAVPPRILDVEGATSLAVQLAQTIAASMPVVRIALVIDMSESVFEEITTDRLSALLPGVYFPSGATDPNYKFNAQRRFDVDPAVIMNRICEWTTGQIRVVVNGPSLTAGSREMGSNFLGFKIDVNTSPITPPSGRAVQPFLSEILAEANAIYRGQFGYFRKVEA